MPVPPATSPSAHCAGDGSWDRQLAPFIGSDSADAQGPSTWRDFCDELHANVLGRWLPAGPITQALKTDLFDEAAGTGLCGVLAQHCDHVVGIDISMAVASAASRTSSGLNATLCDVRQLAFADGSFDVVVSNSTLDHFTRQSDITVSLAELHRVTRPQGVLIVTLDNPRHPLVALRSLLPGRLLRALGLQPYFVGATMSLPQLVTTLKSLGWRVDDTTTMMHTVRVAAIPACTWADRGGAHAAGTAGTAGTAGSIVRRWLMAAMLACERLGSLPTRQFTGHFVAVRAVRQ